MESVTVEDSAGTAPGPGLSRQLDSVPTSLLVSHLVGKDRKSVQTPCVVQ